MLYWGTDLPVVNHPSCGNAVPAPTIGWVTTGVVEGADEAALLSDLDIDDDGELSVEEGPLTEDDQEFVKQTVLKILLFAEELHGGPLYPYQREFAYRLVESVMLNDGAQITALQSRQSGKTEVVAVVVAALMILLPRLATVFPRWFGIYNNGYMVGTFAPVEQQAETLFSRIVGFLTSERAQEMLEDPEIDDQVEGGGRLIRLRRCGSFVRMQTANPKAQIESKTYQLIIIDEAQRADERVVNKSIIPMGSFWDATVVMTGTPDIVKGVFYNTIQHNKRKQLGRGGKKNHFQYDWKACAKYNPRYGRNVRRTIERIGEDSDEFRLSYALHWLLDRGMFTTTEKLDELGDETMQQFVKSWFKTPIVIGIDPARKQDSTVLTALWVDWDSADEFGYYDHRILNWLEMHGDQWEEQYYRMVDFISHYSVWAVAVDAQGVGDVVADRLRRLLPPNIEVHEMGSNTAEQSTRWKHLSELMGRNRVSWPAGAKIKRTKTYQRFITQMEELEKVYQGPHVLAAAPHTADAHDDYPDSLALACMLTKEFTLPTVEVTENVFMAHRSR